MMEGYYGQTKRKISRSCLEMDLEHGWNVVAWLIHLWNVEF